MEEIKVITIEENIETLRQVSKTVTLDDKELKKDFEKLEKYCLENDVLAMASVQIGIPKRLIYIKNTNLDLINKMNRNGSSEEEKKYNEAKILINPIIKKRIGKKL